MKSWLWILKSDLPTQSFLKNSQRCSTTLKLLALWWHRSPHSFALLYLPRGHNLREKSVAGTSGLVAVVSCQEKSIDVGTRFLGRRCASSFTTNACLFVGRVGLSIEGNPSWGASVFHATGDEEVFQDILDSWRKGWRVNCVRMTSREIFSTRGKLGRSTKEMRCGDESFNQQSNDLPRQ